jgi:hypothetical protein
VQVLKKTGDYISSMQQKIAKHQEEIQDLKSQNLQLEVSLLTHQFSISFLFASILLASRVRTSSLRSAFLLISLYLFSHCKHFIGLKSQNLQLEVSLPKNR